MIAKLTYVLYSLLDSNALLGAEQIDLDLLTACIISRHATSHRLRNNKALVVQPFTPFAAKVFRCSKHSQSNPQPTTTNTIIVRPTTVHMEFSFYPDYWENFSPDHIRRLDRIMFETYQMVGVFDDVNQDALQHVLPTVYYELSSNKQESTLNKFFHDNTRDHGEEPVSTSRVSTPELKEFVSRWYEKMVPWFKKQYGTNLPAITLVSIYQANCYYGHLSGKKLKREGRGIHDEVKMQELYVKKCNEKGYLNSEGNGPSAEEAKRVYEENKAYDKHLPKIKKYATDKNYKNYIVTLEDNRKVLVIPNKGEYKQTYEYLDSLRRTYGDNDSWQWDQLFKETGISFNAKSYSEARGQTKQDYARGYVERARQAESVDCSEDSSEDEDDGDLL